MTDQANQHVDHQATNRVEQLDRHQKADRPEQRDDQQPTEQHDSPQTASQAEHHDGQQPADQAEQRDDLLTADRVEHRHGVPVLLCASDGPPVVTVQDALDLIGSAFGRSDVVALPATRLDEQFFTLRTGLAGEIMQKFVNYRIRLAIVGDISEHLAASSALRALVVESNRGRQIWFVADLDGLDAHLS